MLHPKPHGNDALSNGNPVLKITEGKTLMEWLCASVKIVNLYNFAAKFLLLKQHWFSWSSSERKTCLSSSGCAFCERSRCTWFPTRTGESCGLIQWRLESGDLGTKQLGYRCRNVRQGFFTACKDTHTYVTNLKNINSFSVYAYDSNVIHDVRLVCDHFESVKLFYKLA